MTVAFTNLPVADLNASIADMDVFQAPERMSGRDTVSGNLTLAEAAEQLAALV